MSLTLSVWFGGCDCISYHHSNSAMQVQLMTTYVMKGEYQGATEVPDPFHGGPEEFDKV